VDGRSGSAGGLRDSSTAAVLLILSVVLLVAVVGGLWFVQMQQPALSDRIPPQISGLRLTRVMTGQEALAQLTQLHGQELGLTGGYVAYYERGATVWVGDTGSDQQAEGLISLMVQKIGAGNKVFANLRVVTIGRTDLHSVDGQGQQHFFYAMGKATVWVAAPMGSGDAFILEALKLIH